MDELQEEKNFVWDDYGGVCVFDGSRDEDYSVRRTVVETNCRGASQCTVAICFFLACSFWRVEAII